MYREWWEKKIPMQRVGNTLLAGQFEQSGGIFRGHLIRAWALVSFRRIPRQGFDEQKKTGIDRNW